MNTEEIQWKYLAGFNSGKSFHRMDNAFVNGREIRKECTAKKTWYYILEEEGEFEDYEDFLTYINK